MQLRDRNAKAKEDEMYLDANSKLKVQHGFY